MSKYRNEKITFSGQKFDSKKEFERYQDLRILEKAGIVQNLKRQVKYVLVPKQYLCGKLIERECAYIADFVYTKNNKVIVEDVKGIKTKDYIIKRKLMLHVHGIRVVEI